MKDKSRKSINERRSLEYSAQLDWTHQASSVGSRVVHGGGTSVVTLAVFCPLQGMVEVTLRSVINVTTGNKEMHRKFNRSIAPRIWLEST